jgi:prepilin-type processing-associated H-X9-DG protein
MIREESAMPKHRRIVGFSLVELLVVLGIIVVLISMLLPAMRRAREDALRVKCANNLRQIGMGLEMYEQAYKRLPGGDVIVWRVVTDTPDGNGTRDALLQVVSGAADLRGALLDNKSCVAETFHCPRQELYGAPAEASSYAMNRNYTGSKLSKGRADIILAYESAGLLAGPAAEDDGSGGGDGPGMPLPPVPDPIGQDAAYRHHLRANWLFFDGHVDLLTGPDAAGPRDGGWGTQSRSGDGPALVPH